jgi:RecB family exonuclease
MSELGRRGLAAQRVEREFEFLLAIGETIVEGRIDLWFEDAGELVLVDYKTDAVQPEDVPYRVEEYALQMRLYALALKHYAGRLPDRACLHFLRPDLVVDISLEPDELEAAVAAVHALTRAQESMQFPLREGGHCFRCGFHRSVCPSNA